MRFFLIPYIALGFVLSLTMGIEYNCEGQEMLPTFYGSPFVHKQESLASSMEYYYSISGLILNILTWSITLFLFDVFIQLIIKKSNRKNLLTLPYKVLIILLSVCSTFYIATDWMMTGRGFDEGRNYWYWNIDKDAKTWGVTCKGEWVLLGNY